MTVVLSRTHLRCLIEATIDDLIVYRRGFARTKQGPFFCAGTVQTLVNKGLLRTFRSPGGRREIRVSGRAA